MDVQLTCRHCKVSDELRDYAVKKTERLYKRFDGVHKVEIILTEEGGRAKAEIIVGVVRGRKCFAEETHDDMFAAVDIVVAKIDRQISKLKGKLRSRGKVSEPPGTVEEQE